MRVISLLIILFYLFVVIACASKVKITEYPVDWRQLDHESLIGQCPNLNGTYKENGDVDNESVGISSCPILSYALLSKLMPESFRQSAECMRFANRHKVELLQSQEEELRVKIWGYSDETKRVGVLHDETYRMEDGDFTCEDGFLVLKKRTTANIYVVGNLLGSEVRSFSRNQDGWLFMKNDTKIAMHYFFIGGKSHNVGWVRWKSVAQ